MIGNMNRYSAFIVAALAVLLAAFPAAAQGARLNVLATTGMVADMARAVAGDRAEVTALMGEGVDPHLYKPTRSDIAKLTRADVVLLNGLRLEGKMDEAFQRVASTGKPVVAVAERVPKDQRLAPPEFDGNDDPHVWMSPALWAHAVDAVRDALSAADPAGAQTYARNADAYRAELTALDAYARRVLASIPANARG